MLEAVISGLVAFFLAPAVIILGRRLEIVGVDVHKPWRPIVPKTGGLAIILGATAGMALGAHVNGFQLFIPVIPSCLIAAFIGLVEDLREEMDPRLKPLLLVFASLPILISGAYSPRPLIPFLGKTRLYRVYPMLVMASYPVVCNAINGLDVLNGSALLTSIPFLIMSASIFYMRGDLQLLILSLIFLAAAAAMLPYNMYPAKTFIGNSGSLFIGAGITFIAIMGSIEVAAIIALMPQIMNEMYVLFSIRGLRSAKSVGRRPVMIEDGVLTASEDLDAPITLLRMICAGIKVDERKAVYAMALISAFAALLGFLTHILLLEG
jgi:UDP-N-acetylmuramyl pentapeptide phosphotransferase/UDP-N-acetylglucosamine-1-phosphate transferase